MTAISPDVSALHLLREIAPHAPIGRQRIARLGCIFDGGVPTAALGLFLHFCIAFIWATIFYAASRTPSVLTRHAVISGILYGVFIYATMNLVVLPLSAFPRKVSGIPLVVATGLFAHMFFIGLPISLATRRALRRLAPLGTPAGSK